MNIIYFIQFIHDYTVDVLKSLCPSYFFSNILQTNTIKYVVCVCVFKFNIHSKIKSLEEKKEHFAKGLKYVL